MNFLLWENDHLKIEQCYTCALPGYLIVSPNAATDALYKLEVSTLKELGGVLARATQAVQSIIKPQKIYCAQFGEEEDAIHFHIFPRTLVLTTEFLRETPNQKTLIHGPVLLDWARTKYKAKPEKVWSIVQASMSQLQNALHT